MANFLIALALVIAVLALGVALLAFRTAPRRMVNDALLELADQRAMLEKLLTRNHAAARAANAEVARTVRHQKRDLIAEAQQALADAPDASQMTLPGITKLRPVSQDAEGTLEFYRRKAGIIP